MLRYYLSGNSFKKLNPSVIIPSQAILYSSYYHNPNIESLPPKQAHPLLSTMGKDSSPEDEYTFATIAISNAYQKAISLKNKYLPSIETLVNTHPHSLQRAHLNLKIKLIKHALKMPTKNFFHTLLPQDDKNSISDLKKLFCSFLSKLAVYGDAISDLASLNYCYAKKSNPELIKYTDNWQSRVGYLLKQFFPAIIANTKHIVHRNYIVQNIPVKNKHVITPMFF